LAMKLHDVHENLNKGIHKGIIIKQKNG
jgi:hypothetical protein